MSNVQCPISNLAFVFPGQGSQTVGMGSDYADSQIFDVANKALGFDLKTLCLNGPAEKLKETEITQPAILTVSYILFNELKNSGIVPSIVAGHSLGEYSALCAAGYVSFEDAVKTVRLRGKFMQEAVPIGRGAMAAVIGLDKNKIEEICKSADVDAANFNSTEQTVISGEKEKIDKAIELCKSAGAKRALLLEVSAPFHSRLMKNAADRLKMELDKINISVANISVLANVTADYVKSGSEIKKLLVDQVTSSVRWVELVSRMVNDGIDVFVEVGPGSILAGLIKRISKDVKIYNVSNKESLEKTLNEIKG